MRFLSLCLALLPLGCALHTQGTRDEPPPAATTTDGALTCIPASRPTTCPFGVGRTVPVTGPGEYCLLGGSSGLGTAYPTPPECLCDLTCACLAAHAPLPNSNCGPDDSATCEEDAAGIPRVTCAR